MVVVEGVQQGGNQKDFVAAGFGCCCCCCVAAPSTTKPTQKIDGERVRERGEKERESVRERSE